MQNFAAQWTASLLVDAAPAAQLLCSGYSAPKPICCGPVGRRRFPESLGSPRPAAPPWRWVVLSPPNLVGVSGAFTSSVAWWAQFALGINPGECCMRRVAAQPCGGRLARGETRQWAKSGSYGGMRVQGKCACVRPDRGFLTSHQDKTACSLFSTCPPSTVHLQSTLIDL